MNCAINRRLAKRAKLLCLVLAVPLCGHASEADGADISALWDFANPALSEQRFRAELENATGDDALVLKTQIARTYVLRKDFAKARHLLMELEEEAEGAGVEARIRYWLERGRSHASHQHPPESRTSESRELARSAYTRALNLAKAAQRDGLAIDALHMFAFVDTEPAAQLKWGLEALDLVNASEQPDARRWAASIHNNIGEALYELDRYEEALTHFEAAVALREAETGQRSARGAYWHVARVLRAQNRIDEALAIQLRLEREHEADGDPRRYVFEELELLYRAKGCERRARYYAHRAASLGNQGAD